MIARYHTQITQRALDNLLDPRDTSIVVQANLAQDHLPTLVTRPEAHFDGGFVPQAIAYIRSQHAGAVRTIVDRQDRQAALVAFGRLAHARQDFYAHSNWVQLWLERSGRAIDADPTAIEICPEPLQVPELVVARAKTWRYLLYRTPLVGRAVKQFYLPADSHEAMHLDDPSRGPFFPFAVAAATKHTRVDFEALLNSVREAGGEVAAALLLRAKP